MIDFTAAGLLQHGERGAHGALCRVIMILGEWLVCPAPEEVSWFISQFLNAQNRSFVRDPIKSSPRLFLALTAQRVQLISDRWSEMRKINLLISEWDLLAKAALAILWRLGGDQATCVRHLQVLLVQAVDLTIFLLFAMTA